MDTGAFLLRLFAVLVAARLAAEVAERIRQPAVLVEIAAGILIGPSLLGIVHHDDLIKGLGEIGAILLLFEVGLHMDLRELRSVGRSAMQVATIGVVVPMALAYPALRAFGVGGSAALFLAAGLTATSVGITARVFTDLRKLASPEARTVLGAAVADDVIGLLILTVVVRAVSEGGVAAGSLIGIMALALGFLLAAAALGAGAAPRLFAEIGDRARSDGTLVVLAVALAVGFAGLASAAKLAPIVGAFVAGVAVAGASNRDEIHRRLVPLGHLLIPVFFLQIGIETRLRAFGNPRVLGIAAALCVVGVAGKIVAGLGVPRGSADRLLVGIGMIPRGEVGLIFASLGLSRGILDARAHAELLLMVLVSTVLTPPVIRWRVRHTARRARAAPVEEPVGGWFRVSSDEVELSGDPPPTLVAEIGLHAALVCATHRPGPRLLEWLGSAPPEPPAWNATLRNKLFELLRRSDVRSWRFLEVSGLLARLLPAVDAALRRRMRDPFELDPTGALRFDGLEGLRRLEEEPDPRARDALDRLEQAGVRRVLLLAALARDVFPDRKGVQAARKLAEEIGLGEQDVELLGFLVGERHLLPAAARRIDLGAEETILELAAHISSVERLDGLYLLARAENGSDPTYREGLEELSELVRNVLDHPELCGTEAVDLVEHRRSETLRALANLIPEAVARRHLEAAPRRYLLAQTPEAIARHVRLVETKPLRSEVRLHADPGPRRDEWTVHLAFVDRQGALAAVAGAFSSKRISVEEASISTWRTGIAIDVFRVLAPPGVDWDAVANATAAALAGAESNGDAVPVHGLVEIDNQASPWHSIVEVRAPDRVGLLYRVASAISRIGAQIHSATVATIDGVAVDRFFVSGPRGGKLDEAGERALRLAFAGKSPRRGLLRRREGSKHAAG